MGADNAIVKVSYTHEAMAELIVMNPMISQGDIALHFGMTRGWISQIIASDAFQARLAELKDKHVNPEIRATIEERFRALVVQSLAVLKEKLDKPSVSDNLALRAAELGARGLGAGGFSSKSAPPPAHEGGTDRLLVLAARLVDLRPQERVIDAEAKVVS